MYYLWVTSKKLILISALVWRAAGAKNYQLFLISPFHLAHWFLSLLGQSQASIGSRDHVTALSAMAPPAHQTKDQTWAHKKPKLTGDYISARSSSARTGGKILKPSVNIVWTTGPSGQHGVLDTTQLRYKLKQMGPAGGDSGDPPG